MIYERSLLLSLSLNHRGLVIAASGAPTLVAVTLAVLVTRPSGAALRPLARSIANMGQTFPPVAVLALAVPSFGFSSSPTLVALFLYGRLLILENVITGLPNLPGPTMEAARGIGLSRWQSLTRLEISLALPVILMGIRLSVVIALGTAMIGSTVSARTLGEVIIAGILTNKTAFVLHGGLIVDLFALLFYDAMIQIEASLGHGARI